MSRQRTLTHTCSSNPTCPKRCGLVAALAVCRLGRLPDAPHADHDEIRPERGHGHFPPCLLAVFKLCAFFACDSPPVINSWAAHPSVSDKYALKETAHACLSSAELCNHIIFAKTTTYASTASILPPDDAAFAAANTSWMLLKLRRMLSPPPASKAVLRALRPPITPTKWGAD